MGVSENRGEIPPNHPFVHRVFHEINHPLWGPTPIFGNVHIFFLEIGQTHVNVLISKIYTGDQNQKNCRKQIVSPQHIYIYYIYIIYIYVFLNIYIIYIL